MEKNTHLPIQKIKLFLFNSHFSSPFYMFMDKKFAAILILTEKGGKVNVEKNKIMCKIVQEI